MKEVTANEHSDINELCIFLQALNSVYYETEEQICFFGDQPWSTPLVNVIQESIKLGLIKGDRFSESGISLAINTEQCTSEEIPTLTEAQGISPEYLIKDINKVFELTKDRVSISVGGSAPVSETSEDKAQMEDNVSSALIEQAVQGSILVNGGVGQDDSLMRIAVESYIKNNGQLYIAVIPQKYLTYELKPFKSLHKKYGKRVRMIVVDTEHQRELMFKAIAERSTNPTFIVSGAGLGTLKELCIFLRDRKPHQIFHILNHTQYAQKLIELMNRLGLNEGTDFQVRR